MDEFLIKYLKEKFRLSKIVKKNCLQALLAVTKYSSEDIRIDYFRKFLGIGQHKIRTEVIDNYFIILKNLKISFFKLYEDSENVSNYKMTLENCCLLVAAITISFNCVFPGSNCTVKF